ncbi:hypothetical protein HPC38_05665 [Pasteurellaceae bacterium HPA106]|uniref:glycosyltransferase n=1 Tax=Spirabiliibacterium pneumoniae TaxID=221400 RepID=UPI001AAD7E3A|nr:glycosyltransferase [Spirabiliibacterium pneumoniae]MBE2896359.1 hypothetical protein [Spirabiliibacterium pneumoniae]
MIKKLDPIKMLWIGERFSRLEHLCISSFLFHGHPVHLYCYSEIKNVPNGVIHKDANRIISKDKIFTKNGSYALFADLFRWKLLFEQGGYYSDTDVLCLRPFDFEEEVIIGQESTDFVNISVLKLPKAHFIAKEMLDSALNPNKLKPYDTSKIKRKKIINKLLGINRSIGWGETAGPKALTRFLNHKNNPIKIKDFTHFYPVSAEHFLSLFDHTLSGEKLFKNTYAVHLWNELLRRHNFDKDAPFLNESFVGEQYARYGLK